MKVFIVIKTNNKFNDNSSWNVEAVYENREDAYNFLRTSSAEYAKQCTVVKKITIEKQ